MKDNLTRRGKASRRLKYDAGTGANGERQTRYVTLRGTKAQAQAEASKILASLARGEHVDPSGETVAQFVGALAARLGRCQRQQQNLDALRAGTALARRRSRRCDANSEANRR